LTDIRVQPLDLRSGRISKTRATSQPEPSSAGVAPIVVVTKSVTSGK